MSTEYTNPLFTVDSVLFTVKNGQLMVLLVKRAQAPFTGAWALPGGFIDVEQDTNTDATASRKLEAKTGLKPAYLEQLQVISGPDRDPRGFSVTLAYFALVACQDVSPQISSVESASWIAVSDLEKTNLAFDHLQIIQMAKQRLQQKTLYSMTPIFCLPAQFTIAQLKTVIEAIIEKPIQRKSLMRRIEASRIFEIREEKVSSGGRMAQLYTLKPGADLVNFERNLSL
ncbi:NUDIX domain-containing protein [Iodobacter fluviatilis]|uniref:ADP-ribose pyrophosphatase YjhB (NUDIX family) n=1 Tax=Iodobacter fluviatilis TaxID=537 RepID=A0A377Q3Q1_9NEIS|nr:NUDIX hydrolase [Iodobacter fluviatilis]TCU90361.1 ADP-ribose pyrophosphatase YjhB (NUDIX family) [Iodobacter fluviatilis]STQ89388.1 Bifunctional NMN adenylyltransferase/Nudix hydrolase [Iodobacter fluviatilis]